MSATITRVTDLEATTPELVLGYESSRSSRNVIHDLIDGSIAVTLVGPRLRAGSLELFYPVEADAWDAFVLHTEQADKFTLVDSDVPDVDMMYVIDGDVTVSLDDETRAVWVVRVGYQEVEA